MSRVFQEKVRISGFSLCPGDQQLGPGTEQIWLPGIFQLEERSSLNLNLQPWEWGGTGQPLLWLGDHLPEFCLTVPQFPSPPPGKVVGQCQCRRGVGAQQPAAAREECTCVFFT